MNMIQVFFNRLDLIAQANQGINSDEGSKIDISKGYVSFLFIPTEKFNIDILKSKKGIINILGALELQVIDDYGYCKINNALLKVDIVEDIKDFIRLILTEYSLDVTDFIMLDLDVNSVINKDYTIKDIRQGLGLSQQEFSELIETTQTYLSALEKGRRNQGLQIIARIMELVPLLDIAPLLKIKN